MKQVQVAWCLRKGDAVLRALHACVNQVWGLGLGFTITAFLSTRDAWITRGVRLRSHMSYVRRFLFLLVRMLRS